MRNRHIPLLLISLSLALGLAACQGKKSSSGGGDSIDSLETPTESKSGATDTAGAKAEAEQIFSSRCAACHGPQGKGDGPASAGLDPHPRNFTDDAWQKSVTDDHIEKIIVYGGAAVGRSPAMPANPDLASKTAVVAAIKDHIRELDSK
ncbi:MAG: c-type cytochrome [Myxococcales bacterium]|nr:c-type cytochrome [Myxococcales bacterium]